MRKAFIYGLALCALAPSRAWAQVSSPAPTTTSSTESIDEVRKNYRIHAGPFYVNPAILLKDLGVDTNVFNQAGEQKSDFTFTVTPQTDVAVTFARRGLLKAMLGADVVYYATYDSERSVDPQATLRAEAYANRLTLFAEDSYLNTRQRPNYEIDVRSRHLQNDLSAGLNVRLTAKTSVEVAGRQGRTRFDGDTIYFGSSLKDALDRDTTGVAITAKHKLSALTTLAARYERIQDEFLLSPVRNTDSYRVMPGVEFKPRALISGIAYVGYRSFTPKSPTLPEYSGLVSQVGLSYTLLGSTTFGVTADRDVSYSFEQLTPYFVDNGTGVFVRRAIGGRWDVLASAARHRYVYRNLALSTAALVPLPERVDITDSFTLNLGYRMKRQTRIGFGGSYHRRTSTAATFRDYDGLRVGTTVNYGF
jgi:hypothetical protein